MVTENGTDKQANRLSDSISCASPDEAHERFMKALTSPCAEQMAKSFANDSRARAFGVASSPPCFNGVLAQKPVHRQELQRAASEINGAAGNLLDLLEAVEATDAGRYMNRRRRLARCKTAIEDMVASLPEVATAEPQKRKPGRPQRAGADLVIAHALAELWTRCGFGEPKLSPQSRFVRACSIVLPWHGIFKADVAQFMRGELRKPKPKEVII